MIGVQDLKKGTTFELDGSLYRVLDYEHRKVARGGATIRIKARDLRSGATIERTFNSGHRVQDIQPADTVGDTCRTHSVDPGVGVGGIARADLRTRAHNLKWTCFQLIEESQRVIARHAETCFNPTSWRRCG